MNVKLFNASLLTACVVLVTASPVNAIGYTFTELGTLGGRSVATAINNIGQVAGYSNTLTGATHATIWNGATPTDLGTLGGLSSYADAINDVGQVVGRANTSSQNGDTIIHATIWNGTTPTDLGTLGSDFSAATAINNAGKVAGYSDTLTGVTHATIWNGTTPTILDPSGGNFGLARGINDAGQVVGISYISGDINHINIAHATVWDGSGVPTDLGPLGSGFGFARAINDVGQVVGIFGPSSNDPFHGIIWNGTTPTDLNDFLDASAISAGWYLNVANGINENGWIVGMARNTITGAERAFLLTPVPEPETYAMFMAGLGLMGFIARRRKNGQA